MLARYRAVGGVTLIILLTACEQGSPVANPTASMGDAGSSPGMKSVASMRAAVSGEFPIGGLAMALCTPVELSRTHPEIKATINMFTDSPGRSMVLPEVSGSDSAPHWILNVQELTPEKSRVELQADESVPSDLIDDIWDAVKECAKQLRS